MRKGRPWLVWGHRVWGRAKIWTQALWLQSLCSHPRAAQHPHLEPPLELRHQKEMLHWPRTEILTAAWRGGYGRILLSLKWSRFFNPVSLLWCLRYTINSITATEVINKHIYYKSYSNFRNIKHILIMRICIYIFQLALPSWKSKIKFTYPILSKSQDHGIRDKWHGPGLTGLTVEYRDTLTYSMGH